MWKQITKMVSPLEEGWGWIKQGVPESTAAWTRHVALPGFFIQKPVSNIYSLLDLTQKRITEVMTSPYGKLLVGTGASDL